MVKVALCPRSGTGPTTAQRGTAPGCAARVSATAAQAPPPLAKPDMAPHVGFRSRHRNLGDDQKGQRRRVGELRDQIGDLSGFGTGRQEGGVVVLLHLRELPDEGSADAGEQQPRQRPMRGEQPRTPRPPFRPAVPVVIFGAGFVLIALLPSRSPSPRQLGVPQRPLVIANPEVGRDVKAHGSRALGKATLPSHRRSPVPQPISSGGAWPRARPAPKSSVASEVAAEDAPGHLFPSFRVAPSRQRGSSAPTAMMRPRRSGRGSARA